MIPAGQSASFACQMEQVLDPYEQPYNADYPVVCLDESPKQRLDYAQFSTSTGQRCRDSEYVRRGVVELFVATEPRRGWRYRSVEADHKAATWVQFVARQLDTTYREAKKVRWVMDKLSTHKLSFFYTPAHGSWLNMAEIEFSVLSRQVPDQPFTTAEQVRRVVEHGQDRQNTRLKPRNWHFKTTDARPKPAKLSIQLFNVF